LEHLRVELEQVPEFKVCSADTLLRMQKELVTAKETNTVDNETIHELNMKLNKLIVKLVSAQYLPKNRT
jgi:hypothetical protein